MGRSRERGQSRRAGGSLVLAVVVLFLTPPPALAATARPDSSYTGCGQLYVNDSEPQLDISDARPWPTFAPCLTVGGVGVVGSVWGVKDVYPGTQAGTGIFTVVGNASTNGLIIRIDGELPGTGYDQLVAGGVWLGGGTPTTGATLNLQIGIRPPIGTSFQIVKTPEPVTGIFAGLPDGATFDASCCWVPGSYRINYRSDGIYVTHVSGPTSTFYFAEGYTGPGFHETLSLFIPTELGADQAQIDYYTQSHHTTATMMLTPGQVSQVDVNAAVGPDQEVSARVVLPTMGIAERTMTFDGQWVGSTDIVGAPSTGQVWDFAEGSTLDAFNEYLTLQNPNDSPAEVTLNYFTDLSDVHPRKTLTLSPNSRSTVAVFQGDALSETCTPPACGVGRGFGGVSVQVRTVEPIVAERVMYVNGYDFGDGVIRDGHDDFGAADAGGGGNVSLWFAEGTTLPGFKEYLAILNPNTDTAVVTIDYFTDTGLTRTVNLTVDGGSRRTVEVFNRDSGVGPGWEGVSARVTPSSGAVLVERAIYMVHDFGSGPVRGATVAGLQSCYGPCPPRTYGFAQLSTTPGENDFLSLLNVGSAGANVAIVYYTPSGPIARNLTVPPNTRRTVQVFDVAEGPGSGIGEMGAVVVSDLWILVEKETYNHQPGVQEGAAVTFGFSPPGNYFP